VKPILSHRQLKIKLSKYDCFNTHINLNSFIKKCVTDKKNHCIIIFAKDRVQLMKLCINFHICAFECFSFFQFFLQFIRTRVRSLVTNIIHSNGNNDVSMGVDYVYMHSHYKNIYTHTQVFHLMTTL
jgi:hypothetical protein